MFNIIKNEQRYHFENDWLSSYWHFSFDHYYDADNMGFGPLRVFNDDIVQPSSGFPTHAHREMEIITYVLDGELDHKDDAGGSDRIRAGEVQRMSAGTGIHHSEYNSSNESAVHLLQVWIIPAVKNLAPSYEQLRFSKTQREGRLLALASGQGVADTVKVHQDTTFYASALRASDQITHYLGKQRRAYLFVINGSLKVNDNSIFEGDQARITEEANVTVEALNDSELILIDLP